MTPYRRAQIWNAEIQRIFSEGKHPDIAIRDAECRIKAHGVMTFAMKTTVRQNN